MMEDWEKQIIARDVMDMVCLTSKISNLLYPEFVMGKDREAKFFAEGGAFAKLISDKADLKAAELRAFRAERMKE